MTLLDRVRERTGTDLSDGELTAMLEAVAAEIEARIGAAGPVTVTIGDPADRQRWKQTLSLTRPLDEGEDVTIVEIDPAGSGDATAEVTLEAADYRVLHGGRTLQRLSGGPHGHRWWAPMVQITYTPVGVAQAVQDEVAIKLVQLDLTYRGLIKSERAGDYQWQGSDSYAAERERLLAGLNAGGGLVMA